MINTLIITFLLNFGIVKISWFRAVRKFTSTDVTVSVQTPRDIPFFSSTKLFPNSTIGILNFDSVCKNVLDFSLQNLCDRCICNFEVRNSLVLKVEMSIIVNGIFSLGFHWPGSYLRGNFYHFLEKIKLCPDFY